MFTCVYGYVHKLGVLFVRVVTIIRALLFCVCVCEKYVYIYIYIYMLPPPQRPRFS